LQAREVGGIEALEKGKEPFKNECRRKLNLETLEERSLQKRKQK